MSNIYFFGMCISLAIYVIIGVIVSQKVKDANDYYVAGRRAPMLLIAGSLIASYTSTGMFMGDAAQCYDGAFSSIVLFSGMQSAGYIIGAVFFGRYLRRSNVYTIPEFFGKRFDSIPIRKLAAITAIVMMSVYLLSVLQGIGTLMSTVTNIDYRICIILTMCVLTFITIISGSSGVLITDTLMASIFTFSLIISSIIIFNEAGGLYEGIKQLTLNNNTKEILSWSGKPGVLFNTGWENVFWGINYGIVWMSVCAVGPWQSSRYLMAKNENVIIKSSFISAIGVFILEFFVGLTAVFINNFNFGMKDSSQVMIWAAMNLLPKVLGVILLTGVLAAGISSATTFLSLVGSSFANDIILNDKKIKDDFLFIRNGKIAMLVVSIIVTLLAVFNPPSIFWTMFLGGAIAASSWMPVAIMSIISKNITKKAAFFGMLFGFLGCFVIKLYSSLNNIILPVWLDPSIVGIVLNFVVIIVISHFTKITKNEISIRKKMFILPKEEINKKEFLKTLKFSFNSITVGIIVFLIMLFMWVLPFLNSK